MQNMKASLTERLHLATLSSPIRVYSVYACHAGLDKLPIHLQKKIFLQ